ncbi:hypothetical protein ACS0TY_020363 [Phlomoides rotata]
MSELIGMSDTNCFDNLRLNRDVFNRLCYLLRHTGGLVDGRYITMGEQVALFLSVLSHHSKVRVVKFRFKRSGQTIHTYFHNVLRAVLRLHEVLLAKPSPITDDSTHPSWKHFKGCLGALDGTLIDVTVPKTDKTRYRTRKGTVSVNVLVVCDRGLRFTYMLAGWEGSAADSRVLRDAIARDDGLRVPHGNFYLCDNGYPNGEGLLTPYKMVRYHLHEWGIGPSTPQNYKEYYNMHHSKARNNKIILACALIHNFIRNEIPEDSLAEGLLLDTQNQAHDVELIDSVQPSQKWTSWRDTLAHDINVFYNNVFLLYYGHYCMYVDRHPIIVFL